MAIWVFLHHASRTSYGSALRRPVIDVVAKTGYLGVGFFFVLSGFILTINRADELSTRSFAVRRFARIYPLYLLVIVTGVLLDLISKDVFHPAALLAGVFLLQAWFNQPDVYFVGVVAGWSLSVEMFLYVVFPAAARRLRLAGVQSLWRIVIALLATSAAVTALVAVVGADAVYWLYILPLSRVVEFLLGIVTARFYLQGHRLQRGHVMMWVAAIGLVVLAPHVPDWLSRSALLTPVWPLLVISLASVSTPFSRWLSSAAMTRLGESSYALYLVHGLVLTVTFSVLDRVGVVQRTLSSWSSLVIVVAAALTSVGASIALLDAVERPAQRWLRKRLDVAR
jgi:peptidoglycan/LPS O-acetylase OafA/YrhL